MFYPFYIFNFREIWYRLMPMMQPLWVWMRYELIIANLTSDFYRLFKASASSTTFIISLFSIILSQLFLSSFFIISFVCPQRGKNTLNPFTLKDVTMIIVRNVVILWGTCLFFSRVQLHSLHTNLRTNCTGVSCLCFSQHKKVQMVLTSHTFWCN